MRPLSHRFKKVDRLGGLNLDDTVQTPAVLCARQHEVWIHGPGFRAHGRGLLLSMVDRHREAPAQSALKLADNPIVFELLANRSEKNGGH